MMFNLIQRRMIAILENVYSTKILENQTLNI